MTCLYLIHHDNSVTSAKLPDISSNAGFTLKMKMKSPASSSPKISGNLKITYYFKSIYWEISVFVEICHLTI